ncbi:hypothetical protein Ac2012v2_003573 [Leucoagaricus gongylophorus]
MESVPTLPAGASLLLGPPLIGVSLSWWLYGIFVMQYFVYLNGGYRDPKWLKAVVHFLFLIESAQTFMIMDDVFFWFVHNFGNYPALLRFNVAAIDGPFLDVVITFTVQIVYCWRLRKIGQWKILPIIAALLSLVSCVGGMIAGIHSQIDPTHIKSAIYVWLFSTAITDIVIASSMAYLLLQYRTAEASQTTITTVTRILLLTLETNAVTAAEAVALVAVFLHPSVSPPKTNIYMVMGYTLGKMYSNCFMVLLNQRIYWDTSRKGSDEIGSYGSSRGNRSRGHDHRFSSQNQTTGQISVIQFSGSRNDGPSEYEMSNIHETQHSLDLKSGSNSV